MIRIDARETQKYYQKRLVLDVDVEFKSGLYALLGPNGSGKSTLLRLLASVEKPDRGEIVYHDGEKLLPHNLSLARRLVLVPDRKGLFNDTLVNNVAYGLKIRRLDKKTRDSKVQEVLEKVGLWHLRKSNALDLSTGESQRLCLAMALAVEPEVILLDEPTSSLDPDSVALVEEIIRGIKAKKWLIVMVTHNVFQARRLADRVLLLLQGRIMEDNDAAAFFEQPASQAGRRFLAGEILYEGNGRVNPFPG